MEILSCLDGTKSFGLTHVRGLGLELEVYADADYADKTNYMCSASGIAITLVGNVRSYACRKPHVVSLSTSVAE